MPDESEEAGTEADTEVDTESNTEAEDDPEPASKKAKTSKKTAKKTPKKSKEKKKERQWKKEDISYPKLPTFTHPAPDELRIVWEYFEQMFPVDIIEDIVYQTNLYARQRNVNTKFSIDKHELMVFIENVIYRGVINLPSIEDYWAEDTRVMQVAEFMSSKRFRTIRSFLHFNNNENFVAGTTTDRFFKIRPLIASITEQFLKVKETPTQSIDEVMVAYKGTRTGNLMQYICTKPDKWGLKLFCRVV